MKTSKILTLLFLSRLFTTAAPGGNLVKNPGFEEGGENWRYNNWAKNEVDFSVVTENHHSGKYCQRIGLKNIKELNAGKPAFVDLMGNLITDASKEKSGATPVYCFKDGKIPW